MKTLKCDNSAQTMYENTFNSKINHFQDHTKYNWLREYADDALRFHIGFGHLAIKAVDFMDRIIAMPIDYIEDWLNDKNKLEWTEEFKQTKPKRGH